MAWYFIIFRVALNCLVLFAVSVSKGKDSLQVGPEIQSPQVQNVQSRNAGPPQVPRQSTVTSTTSTRAAWYYAVVPPSQSPPISILPTTNSPRPHPQSHDQTAPHRSTNHSCNNKINNTNPSLGNNPSLTLNAIHHVPRHTHANTTPRPSDRHRLGHRHRLRLRRRASTSTFCSRFRICICICLDPQFLSLSPRTGNPRSP